MDQEMKDVLEMLGLEQYEEKFAEEEVGIKEYKELDQQSLKELVPKVGHRIKLLSHLKTLLDDKVANLDSSNNCLNSSLTMDSENNLSQSIDESPVSKRRKCQNFGDKMFTGGKTTEQFINSSKVGSIILASYKRTKKLQPEERSRLVHIIVDDLIEKFDKVSNDQFEVIAEAIVETFPSEVKGSYYIPREDGRKISGGKLVERFRNQRKLISRESKIGVIEEIPQSTEVKDAYDWLKTATDPWEKVMKHWEITCPMRHNAMSTVAIHEYYRTFPALSLPMGYKLLETDYNNLYNGNDGLVQKYSKAAPILWDIVSSHVNPVFKGSFTDCSDRDWRDFLLFRAIAGYLPAAVGRRNNQSYRPAVVERMNGIIQPVKAFEDLQQQIEDNTKHCELFKTTRQPLVVAVTPKEGVIESCHVVVDKTIYSIPGMLKCLDASFKIIMALDAQYNTESRHAYLFIQRYFYQIKCKSDKMTSAIFNLVGKLEKSEGNDLI